MTWQPANGAAKTSEPSHVGEKGVRVEEQINNEHLRRIERMFHEADTDGGGGQSNPTTTITTTLYECFYSAIVSQELLCFFFFKILN